eukprot:3425347-Amphidinium_carterae.1
MLGPGTVRSGSARGAFLRACAEDHPCRLALERSPYLVCFPFAWSDDWWCAFQGFRKTDS